MGRRPGLSRTAASLGRPVFTHSSAKCGGQFLGRFQHLPEHAAELEDCLPCLLWAASSTFYRIEQVSRGFQVRADALGNGLEVLALVLY